MVSESVKVVVVVVVMVVVVVVGSWLPLRVEVELVPRVVSPRDGPPSLRELDIWGRGWCVDGGLIFYKRGRVMIYLNCYQC